MEYRAREVANRGHGLVELMLIAELIAPREFRMVQGPIEDPSPGEVQVRVTEGDGLGRRVVQDAAPYDPWRIG